MAYSFTVSQSAVTPSDVTVTDTSTGLPGTVTQRRIFLSNAYGEFLTGDGTVDYTAWPLANASITLDVLTENTAALILVQWLDVSNAVVDEVEDTYPLSEFGQQFFYYLVGLQGLTPGIYQDTNYSGNLAIFWSNLVAGNNAVTYGNDIAGAQNCYNRCTEMQLNENSYF